MDKREESEDMPHDPVEQIDQLDRTHWADSFVWPGSIEGMSPLERSLLVNDGTPMTEQVGGDHYRKLGPMQPWNVLRAWLTEEEFRGFMKGTAIVYLARERDKGGDQDIEKARHTLEGLQYLMKTGSVS